MDAVEFLMAKARFCKDGDCGECEIYDECDKTLDNITTADAERIVDVVEKWAKEHPIKTRQSEFLKMFPEANMLYDEYLNICPAQISSAFRNKKTGGCYDPRMDCKKCRRDYWLQEVE